AYFICRAKVHKILCHALTSSLLTYLICCLRLFKQFTMLRKQQLMYYRKFWSTRFYLNDQNSRLKVAELAHVWNELVQCSMLEE
uniref:Uncharacterized protein n=1 Tax=Aegilops tauschii subsp. strangulata TaxID=200361 RepID=A0A452ZT62_AEGTS